VCINSSFLLKGNVRLNELLLQLSFSELSSEEDARAVEEFFKVREIVTPGSLEN
jgi:hypothetical protein